MDWTKEAAAAYESIKQELQTTPALGTPDTPNRFRYTVCSQCCDGYAAAALCQGRKKQPLAYYSMKLDRVAQGWPPCYQGVSTLTMGYPIIIHMHHKIAELLEQGRFVFTAPRSTYSVLLTYPDVAIVQLQVLIQQF